MSGDICQWSGFRQSNEAVHAGEQVLVTPGERQGAPNVYVDVLEPGEGTWRGADVVCHLRGLALQAGVSPQPYVVVHASPSEAGRHQLL